MPDNNEKIQMIAELLENVKRIRQTINSSTHWNPGYVANCEANIISYENQIKLLENT